MSNKWKINFIDRNFKPTNFLYWDNTRTEGEFGMPTLEPVDHVPDHLLGFNYAKSSTDYTATIHFFLDDYLFERVWCSPEKYIRILSGFRAVMSPNYSIYYDMPEAMKIWNTFRARLLGQMMQDWGLTVVPIVYWSDERSYAWCFDGIPDGGTLAVTKARLYTEEQNGRWEAGMQELVRRKKPKRIILYGNKEKIDADYGDTEILYYRNSVTERMQKRKDNER